MSALGEDDTRFVRVSTIEKDRVAHEAAEFGICPFGELTCHALLIIGFSQPNLDQLVNEELRHDLSDHFVGDSRLSNLDDWLSRVAQASEVLALESFHEPRPFAASVPIRMSGLPSSD